MRKAFEAQLRLDLPSLDKIEFDLTSRHELESILAALHHLYKTPETLNQILALIENDINRDSSMRTGSPGLLYWEILVLASVYLGCDLDFDAMSDLANNHKKLRLILGVGEWEDSRRFPRSTIHGNIRKLTPETIQQISNLICAEGHKLRPDAIEKVRGDSVVVQTNIHYPTDASLLVDAVRKILNLSAKLGRTFHLRTWQHWRRHLRTAKSLYRTIQKIAATTSLSKPELKEKLKAPYQELIDHASDMALKALQFKDNLDIADLPDKATRSRTEMLIAELEYYLMACGQIACQAERRVINGETLANREKVFSIFEPHTLLINRGKSHSPIEFGRPVFFVEDAGGFIVDYKIMEDGETDEKIVVPIMRTLQKRMHNRIKVASFDMGFWSPDNLKELEEIVEVACLPKKGRLSLEAKLRESSPLFRQARRWHPGIESAIHALVASNGLVVCRARGEVGYHRYVALGVLGRNLHTLGRTLLDQERATQKQRRRAA